MAHSRHRAEAAGRLLDDLARHRRTAQAAGVAIADMVRQRHADLSRAPASPAGAAHGGATLAAHDVASPSTPGAVNRYGVAHRITFVCQTCRVRTVRDSANMPSAIRCCGGWAYARPATTEDEGAGEDASKETAA
jgi:hypothetical protein